MTTKQDFARQLKQLSEQEFKDFYSSQPDNIKQEINGIIGFNSNSSPSLLSKIKAGINPRDTGLINQTKNVPKQMLGNILDIPDAITSIPSLIQKGIEKGTEFVTGKDFVPGYAIPGGTSFGKAVESPSGVVEQAARLLGPTVVTGAVKTAGKIATKPTILKPLVSSLVDTVNGFKAKVGDTGRVLFNTLSSTRGISKEASDIVFETPEVLNNLKNSNVKGISFAEKNVYEALVDQNKAFKEVDKNIGQFLGGLSPDAKDNIFYNAELAAADRDYIFKRTPEKVFVNVDNPKTASNLAEITLEKLIGAKLERQQDVAKVVNKINDMAGNFKIDISNFVDQLNTSYKTATSQGKIKRDVHYSLKKIIENIKDATKHEKPNSNIIGYNPVDDIIDVKSLNVAEMHLLKKSIQDVLEAREIQVPGDIKTIFTTFENQINKTLQDNFPEYAMANEKYSSFVESTKKILGDKKFSGFSGGNLEEIKKSGKLEDFYDVKLFSEFRNKLNNAREATAQSLRLDAIPALRDLGQANLANIIEDYLVGKLYKEKIFKQIEKNKINFDAQTKLGQALNSIQNKDNVYSKEVVDAINSFSKHKFLNKMKDNLAALEYQSWSPNISYGGTALGLGAGAISYGYNPMVAAGIGGLAAARSPKILGMARKQIKEGQALNKTTTLMKKTNIPAQSYRILNENGGQKE